MNKWLTYHLIIGFVVLSCTQQNRSIKDELPAEIQVKSAYDKKEKVLLSDIAQSIEYIPLETKEESIISRFPRVFADESLILVVTFNQILVFDRNTGNFLREISSRGKGPQEYRVNLPDPFVEEGVIWAKGSSNKIMKFDLSGNLVKEIALPNYDGDPAYIEMSSGLYAQYISNIRGDNDIKIVVFDSTGQDKHIFRNDNFYKRENPKVATYFGREAEFYNYDEKTFFKEMWNDTLFQIKDTLLIAKYVFNSEKYGLDYEIRGVDNANEKVYDYFKIENYLENDNFIFFLVKYQQKELAGYYEKASGITRLSNYESSTDNGFIDDITGFTDFIPRFLNFQGELVGFVSAEAMVTYIENNPDTEIPDNLKNLEIDDNLIVTIAR